MNEHFAEETFRCQNCGLTWTPARIVEFHEESLTDDHGEFRVKGLIPSNSIRCVECKSIFDRPLTEEQKQVVANVIEALRDAAKKRRKAIFEGAANGT